MTAQRPVEILGIGMTTAVGLTAPTTAAAVRAGVSLSRETSVLDRRFKPIVMTTVPEADLPGLSPALHATLGLTARQMRMLRLGGPALRESVAGVDRVDRIPVLLAVPEPYPGRPAVVGPGFLQQLAVQAEVPFHLERSRIFPQGRAAGFAALHEAIERLASGSDVYVIVGGIDSHLDLHLLAALDLEGRLRAERVFDGFIPGEGAAFLLLSSAGKAEHLGRSPSARIDGAASAEEPGHRYSEEFYRGDGLDLAFRRLFASTAGAVQTVYAGLNGESFNAKEWGVAYIRHRERFAEGATIEHPVDCLGDTGAALGPMLVGLAAVGINRGYRRAPCLVWCSSDCGGRGAAMVSGAQGREVR
ncbi:beta-ketoacyl synthase N-terminal-like domain-containing protein [Sorangium sp. So ce295]|jgi:3-oxoacyl-[acyl-carrier-protein] synthase-1|uniref:beta-ketoacyl synthase N-terminal-like domain-containing protein n=1 Tax=Sorangium sp. So ce295 TaxID=3133295 RepID=UPI003F62BF44